MLINTDLHIHSCFSMATSKDMTIKNIASKAKEKGLSLVGTGDCFHPKWLNNIEESTEYIGDGIYSTEYCNFVLTVEIEGYKKIHHLLIIPNIDVAKEIGDKIVYGNKKSDGRPKTKLKPSELLDIAHDYNCLIGPAHAFTPWTGMYKTYEEIDNISYTSLKNSIKHKGIKGNYGLYPNLGKYHMTGCSKCHKLIDPQLAKENNMECVNCGGRIKKGVDYRINEISDFKNPKHPKFRPPYIHIMPLLEIISKIYNKGITTKTVQNIWRNLIDNFKNEIDVLINSPINKIEKIDYKTSKGIKAFRENKVEIISGGGGKYGEISFNKLIENNNQEFMTLDSFK